MLSPWYWVASALISVCATAQAFVSADVARNVAFLLESRSLDAIAAADPRSPGTFVAGLSFGRNQLLVVRAVHPMPETIARLIRKGDYRGVYFELHRGSRPEDRFFGQDQQADGLLHELPGSGAVDFVYEFGDSTRFNGDPQGQGLTDADYDTRFQHADRQYADALRLLQTALEKRKSE